ncbi:hypothetical protein [Photobacterium sp.]|uniref:hypothetical protein n=1 Tax=Photobacterium sp. TaxID=660 RepID=UPI00299DF8B0|nr:hypothetical protein [Photobacterium sp.]MDX1303133.1 hypothetical protein [Photobacterium sp.]
MINSNNKLPPPTQNQLKKVTQASPIDERRLKIEPKKAESNDQESDQPKKKARKHLLDIYV